MAPLALSKPLCLRAPIAKFQDEVFDRTRARAMADANLRLPRNAWWKVRCLKDLKVENGASFWLVAWDGSDSSGRAWPDSWEPTMNISKDLRDDDTVADFRALTAGGGLARGKGRGQENGIASPPASPLPFHSPPHPHPPNI
ncbi:hypothetical protein AB1Y20_006973 [Prymnesium parvum]|uniref:Chromo domain-containing protein n=1 Tax=Prymnesium parvum TaxID=97485 RepID=A0AB34IZU3_PRYPA